MKKTIFLLMLLAAVVAGVWYGVGKPGNRSLVSPDLVSTFARQSPAGVPTPLPTPDEPKTFKFDRSTDLKAELEKVNPQVLDSDFEQ